VAFLPNPPTPQIQFRHSHPTMRQAAPFRRVKSRERWSVLPVQPLSTKAERPAAQSRRFCDAAASAEDGGRHLRRSRRLPGAGGGPGTRADRSCPTGLAYAAISQASARLAACPPSKESGHQRPQLVEVRLVPAGLDLALEFGRECVSLGKSLRFDRSLLGLNPSCQRPDVGRELGKCWVRLCALRRRFAAADRPASPAGVDEGPCRGALRSAPTRLPDRRPPAAGSDE
jgi:hypothetical protein